MVTSVFASPPRLHMLTATVLIRRDQHSTIAAAVAFEVGGGFLIFVGGEVVVLLSEMIDPCLVSLISDTMLVMLIAILFIASYCSS